MSMTDAHIYTLQPNVPSPFEYSTHKAHHSCCIWFSGLLGAGKKTLVRALEKRIYQVGRRSYIFGGEDFRYRQTSDFEATKKEHPKHVSRLSEAAQVVIETGSIVLVTLFSPFITCRQIASKPFKKEQFIEVYVHTPMEICALRVPKGLYGKDAKYHRQELLKYAGIDDRYELPEQAEIRVDMSLMSLEDCADKVFYHLPEFRLR